MSCTPLGRAPRTARRFRWLASLACVASLLAGLSCGTGLFGPRDPASAREIPAFHIPAPRPGVLYQRFLAFGDHGNGTRGQKRIANAMAQRADRDGVDFMLLLGDNFYESGVESVEDPKWQTRWEQVYASPSLQVPVYPTLGNHDHRGNAQAQVDYSQKSSRWNMPARYYSFEKALDGGERAQFFAIDTERFGPRDPEQSEWLESELSESDARWKIVYGHHPLYSQTDRGDNARMIEFLEPMLQRYEVDLHLAAHHHVLQMLGPIGGVAYAVCGAAGGPWAAHGVRWDAETLYAATRGGFCKLRLSVDELVLEFARTDGDTQFAYVLYKPASE